MRLHDLARAAAGRTPGALAVAGPGGAMSYGELDQAADRIAGALAGLKVRRGDRVGIWSDKSARTVAAMQAVLRLGAAYVPVDPLSPPARAVKILRDCAAKAVVTSAEHSHDLAGAGVGPRLCVDGEGDGLPWEEAMAQTDAPPPDPGAGGDELAYILYTSGSTGDPKGVCISHRAARAFADWAARELAATPDDRFANHAPFHFDLSVLDLYAAFHCGGSVHLIPHELSFAPRQLTGFLREERITVWYSVPSALILMMRDGGLLDMDPGPLRAVLFAGEPFPVKHLRRLRERWPDPRFLNLYGPTETNVCTYHEMGSIPADQTRPVPIGKASCGDRVWTRRPDGSAAAPGEEGELVVEGPTVMLGYWGRPRQDGPYATGDRVVQRPDGAYEYLGRGDDMVKVRGHRVEPGEIEAALLAHPAVADAAVVATGSGADGRLVAYVVPEGPGGPSLLDLKRHSAERLPRHMIVDEVHALNGLPRTGNGKVDRRRLASDAA